MLDVRRLRLLSELARRRTIAEVAKAVGYSPSAVSQSLAQLEREAGLALLERHPELTCLVREHEPEDGIPLLRAGELDVLISEGYARVTPEPPRRQISALLRRGTAARHALTAMLEALTPTPRRPA